MPENKKSARDESDKAPQSPQNAESDARGPKALVHRVIEWGDEIIEELQLPQAPQITVILNYRKGLRKPMPVMLTWFAARERKFVELTAKMAPDARASIDADLPPVQAMVQELMERGCALVCFKNSDPPELPWPEGRPRWIWPTPDPAGAEVFTRSAKFAPGDYATVIDFIETRKDLRADRIGYIGGSTTALTGYGLIAKEPRITCAVLNAGSGYLTGFIEGWARNYDWEKKGFELWPETAEKLEEHDPILFAEKIFPTALLMINGAKDWLIPIESVLEYFEALFPHYDADPDRLQLIIFQGAGHGWDQKWNNFMVVDWFERYLVQETPPEPRPRRHK